MIKIETCVVNEIYRKFSYDRAEDLFLGLQKTDIPMSENGPLYRIHLAILSNSKGSVEEFEGALRLASIDWRDSLVNAKYDNTDWKQVASKNGVVFLENEKLFPIDSIEKYEMELNDYVITFLSGDKDQNGYDPINKEKRLKDKYKNKWEFIKAVVVAFLDSMNSEIPNWEKGNGEQFGDRIRNIIRSKYPFLSSEASNQIVNSVLYGYK